MAGWKTEIRRCQCAIHWIRIVFDFSPLGAICRFVRFISERWRPLSHLHLSEVPRFIPQVTIAVTEVRCARLVNTADVITTKFSDCFTLASVWIGKRVWRTPSFFFCKKKKSRSKRKLGINLSVTSSWSFPTSFENTMSMLCQVIELWRHMSGHVASKSKDYTICCLWCILFLLSDACFCIHARLLHAYWCWSRHYTYSCLTVASGSCKVTPDWSRFRGTSKVNLVVIS